MCLYICVLVFLQVCVYVSESLFVYVYLCVFVYLYIYMTEFRQCLGHIDTNCTIQDTADQMQCTVVFQLYSCIVAI